MFDAPSLLVVGVGGRACNAIPPRPMARKAAKGTPQRRATQEAVKGAHCEKGPSSCGRCKWERNKRLWQAQHPWLIALETAGAWGVGCVACREMGRTGDLALFQVRSPTSLQNCRFKEHAALESHTVAMESLRHPAPPALSNAAPSMEEFRDLWRTLRKTRRLEHPERKSGACRMKNSKKMYCLAEAVRSRDRAFLRTSSCTSLTQDVSTKGHRLLSRFASTNPSLECRQGILGMVRMKAGGHKSLLKATAEILVQASTAMWQAPPRDNRADRPHSKTAATTDRNQLENLRLTTKVWNTDFGADEFLAGKESCCPTAGAVRPLLPNIEFVNRDRAHGSRRVVMRPWLADPYAQALHQLVTGQCSMMSCIQHSAAAKAWYQEYQKHMPKPIVKVQRDMSLARHRFESASKPLAIECLTFHAVNMTAARFWTERQARGKVGRDHLLAFTGEEGVERAIQMGMLADFALEGYHLTLFNDRERADPALLPHVATVYISTIKVLFVDGKALRTGLTMVMLETVKQQVGTTCFSVVGGGGGPQNVQSKTCI